ncbi:hypothetical protein GOBAR_DD17532 [Gossypium barbadense]|nr:hypothetical protein GOBAR_DD17532 [Gossypium barbadense]
MKKLSVEKKIVSEEAKAIQWLARPNNSSEGKDDREEDATTIGNGKGEAADDESSKGRETSPRDEAMDDVATPTCPMIRDVDPREQSMPIHQIRVKKIVLNRRNIQRVDETT